MILHFNVFKDISFSIFIPENMVIFLNGKGLG